MKDFLGECKNIFYMESDLANENEITVIVEDRLIPKPVDLTFYARDNIQDYRNIAQISQDNLDYLNSGLVASDMTYMFNQCRKLQSIPKLNIDTSQCSSMLGMFQFCNSLTLLDLSNFNTTNVTDMNHMFYDCQALTTIDLSNFDTSNVFDMNNMFGGCYALTSLDLSNFNTSKVTIMSSMFGDCRALTTIDLSNFDTSNVIGMSSMFYNCYALTSLDLSNFNTSNVTNMWYMFGYCNSLEHIEGIIDMKSCNIYDNMFYNCTKLSGVKIKNPPDDFESKTYLSSSQYEIVS